VPRQVSRARGLTNDTRYYCGFLFLNRATLDLLIIMRDIPTSIACRLSCDLALISLEGAPETTKGAFAFPSVLVRTTPARHDRLRKTNVTLLQILTQECDFERDLVANRR
jgi:hypothetical protein